MPATIELQPSIDPRCPAVMADPTLIHQVIMNLCTNAVHAMRESGGVLSVAIDSIDLTEAQARQMGADGHGCFVRITVSDTGTGMDEATQARVFDPFFTTKAPGEGTGLGLSTVHGIVRSYRGGIRLASVPAEGTRFEVLLPGVEADAPALGRPPVPAAVEERGLQRVLVVEDEAVLRDAACQMLRALGYEAEGAGSMDAGLEILRDRADEFAGLLTDQTMPGGTGLEMIEAVRQRWPHIPVILCTGYSSKVNAQTYGEYGIDAFLAKPFNLAELGAALDEALGTRAQTV
jgi:CheY-like chemotaxis protein